MNLRTSLGKSVSALLLGVSLLGAPNRILGDEAVTECGVEYSVGNMLVLIDERWMKRDPDGIYFPGFVQRDGLYRFGAYYKVNRESEDTLFVKASQELEEKFGLPYGAMVARFNSQTEELEYVFDRSSCAINVRLID